MTYEELIYPLLKDLVPLPDGDGKVYPNLVPEFAKAQKITPPYIIHQLINTDNVSDLDGYTGNNLARVQFDVYAKDFDECLNLAKLLIWTLDNNITTCQFISRQSTFDKDSDWGLLYRQIVDFYIWQTDC